MIDDMAILKQAMEQMDAEDPVVAQAAKDRAAQTLSNARLSFSKMAALIEQRRLLLRPRIVASIKRMDQPGMLGDAAFRDTGSALRREGQSFRQIAEAIELAGRPSLRYEDPAQNGAPPHPMASEPLDPMAGEPGEPAWMSALVFVASMVFFPLRHPARFLAIALVAILLLYGSGGFASLGQHVFDGVAAVRRSADQAMSSVGSFVDAQILRRSKQATAPPTAPAPIPSAPAASPSATPPAAPATAPAPPATASAPSNASAPPAPPSAAPAAPSASPAGPPAPTPRRDAKGDPPSRSAANRGAAREDRTSGSRGSAAFEDDRPRAFEDIIPGGIRRHSRVAGPCIGGVGGCYWGGGHY